MPVNCLMNTVSAVFFDNSDLKIYSVCVVRRITSSCMVGESLVK